jgi:hypothetical protein
MKFHYDDELFAIRDFHLSSPYFINGLIKVNVSWTKLTDERVQQYELHWIESQCYSDVLSCCYRRDAVTRENTFQLYDLRFNCTYALNIQAIVSRQRVKTPFQVYFNVSSCQTIDIYGTIRPACQTETSTRLVTSPLNLLVRRNETGLQLTWRDLRSSSRSFADNLFVVMRDRFVFGQLALDTDHVYQLRIEQLPDRVELVSLEFSPVRLDMSLTVIQIDVRLVF